MASHAPAMPSTPDPLDRLAAWMSAPVNDQGDVVARWSPVAGFVARKLNEPVQANIDPFLLPLA